MIELCQMLYMFCEDFYCCRRFSHVFRHLSTFSAAPATRGKKLFRTPKADTCPEKVYYPPLFIYSSYSGFIFAGSW